MLFVFQEVVVYFQSLSYLKIGINSGMKIFYSLDIMGFAALELQHPGDGLFLESGTKESKEGLFTGLYISCCIARHISFIACFKVNTQQCLYISAGK